jgi:predicted enzyme related to lactoylglutathione lyase
MGLRDGVVVRMSATDATEGLGLAVEWVIIDCVDPEALAAFWGGLLGVEVSSRKGPYVFLRRPAKGGAAIGLQRVDEPRGGKNRVHIDLLADDVVAVARRVERLGGRRVPGYERGGFLVMADPEGNEFCLIPPDFPMDDDGNVNYLDGLDL